MSQHPSSSLDNANPDATLKVGLNRRSFIASAGAAGAALGVTTSTSAQPAQGPQPASPPAVTDPRAISGDPGHQPTWQESLTITVGPRQADIVGDNARALQAAIDYVAGLGGGTVRILPGTYRLRNSLFLRSNVRLAGSGLETILTKHPSHESRLSADSDWYDQEVTFSNGHGFQIGDGVCLRTRNPHNNAPETLKRTLVARNGSRFKLDRPLRENFWLGGNPMASSLFPLLTGEHIADVVIENLALDGNRANNAHLDGNHAGCIFFQDCNRIQIRGVTARNYNGDGMSWQICHDVHVSDCHSHDNADLGLHPGSGSQRPVMRNNRLERNGIGIFFCWGVRYGLAEGNRIVGSRSFGVSIGHRDTDNLVVNNEILDSGRVGVLFRAESVAAFAPNRNRIENNRVTNSGPDDGVAIDLQGAIEGVQIVRNRLSETRAPARRIGIRVSPGASTSELTDNRIQGFAIEVSR